MTVTYQLSNEIIRTCKPNDVRVDLPDGDYNLMTAAEYQELKAKAEALDWLESKIITRGPFTICQVNGEIWVSDRRGGERGDGAESIVEAIQNLKQQTEQVTKEENKP